MAQELNLTQAQENDAVNLALTKVPYPHVTGMQLRSDIRLNGLTFNTIDASGNVWVCSDIDGWWEMPTADVPDIARGLDDGSYDVRGRWQARSLTLVGSILVSDASKASAARETLMSYINLVYEGGWLIVDEEPYTKATYVRLVGQPAIKNTNPRGRIDFTIPLRASDPLKYYWNPDALLADEGYTTLNTLTSTVTANNIGNMPVSAVFELTGPFTAPMIIENTDANSVKTSIRITRNLRNNGFTSSANVTNSLCSSGLATLTFSGEHGFFPGDVVTVTNLSNFNQSNVTISETTATSITYPNPKATISSIVVSSNVATVTTSSAHGLSNGASIFIKDAFNPLMDGVRTVTANTVGGSSSKFTFSITLPNQTASGSGTVSLQLASASATTGTIALVGADTLKIDTYNGTVLYRGTPDQSRASLDSVVDWIKLQPGANTVRLTSSSGTIGTSSVKYRSGWIG
jgi:hypothetical protein